MYNLCINVMLTYLYLSVASLIFSGLSNTIISTKLRPMKQIETCIACMEFYITTAIDNYIYFLPFEFFSNVKNATVTIFTYYCSIRIISNPMMHYSNFLQIITKL